MGKTRETANITAENLVTTNISSDILNVGTGITMYGGTVGIVSAVSFFGDGSNLTGVSGGTTRTVNRYTATADQTLFPASGTISYNVGYVDVFINGTKLDSTEFTASNGTTVTLTTGATVDDIVELVAFSDVSISGGASSVVVVDESSDTTCFPLFVTDATGDLAPKSGSNLTFNASTGNLSATIVSDASGSLRNLPQNAKTSAYTLVASDTGKHISITTGGVTVPSGIFSVGDIVTIYNNSGSSQTITQGSSVTLRQSGTSNTGNRSLDQYGVSTLMCVASNVFVISGSGLS